MKTITREELKSLAQSREGQCFSFYLSTAKAGAETLENPVRFRSLLREAHDRLLEQGVRRSDADQLLRPATDMLDEFPFWQNQDHGLAVFVAAGQRWAYKIPYAVKPQAVNGTTFYLKPLLPLLAYDGHFFILSLTKNDVSLYRASRYTIEKVNLEQPLPNEAEAVGLDDPEKSLQKYTVPSPMTPARGDAIVHGMGSLKLDTKERALRFFHRVDRALHDFLKDEHAPLLLASVEYYLPLYQQANTYPHFVAEVIRGNPESRSLDELREAAWAKVEPIFKRARSEATDAIAAGLHKKQSTADLDAAVMAAHDGRVDKCLVALEEQCWGAVDEEHATVAKLNRDDRGAFDLLDYAAVQTVLHGGDVFPVSNGERIPGKSPLAVLLRY